MIDSRTTQRGRFRSLVMVAMVVALVAASCGRGESDGTAATSAADASAETSAPTGGGETPDETSEPGEAAVGLENGGFGSLTNLCGPGNAQPVEGQTGIDGTTITLGVFSDFAFAGFPGLNQELIDNANAIAEWCNSLGGVRGYTLEPVVHSSAVTEYAVQMVDACESDFFLVGGGGVLDDAGEPARLGCGLPTISAFSVGTVAANADISLTTLPNPADELGVAEQRYVEKRWPDAIRNAAVTTIITPGALTIRDRYLEYYANAGWEPIVSYEFAALGESNWTPFVQGMKDAGVEVVNAVAIEPSMLAPLLQAAQTIEYEPTVWLVSTNNYDPTFVDVAGDTAVNVFTRSAFWPIELAEENPATQDYLELLDGGKHSTLGEQAVSSWMLFIQSLGICADAGTVTRDCVYTEAAKNTEWYGGGLHGALDVTHQRAPGCAIVMEATPDGWVVAPEQTFDETGYNCDSQNRAPLTGDYGEGAKCPSGAEDPLPSTCPA